MNPYYDLIEDAQVVDEKSIGNAYGVKTTYSQQKVDINKKVQDRIFAIKSGDFAGEFMDKLKGSTTGLVVGGVIGLAVGMFYKKNLYFTSIMGGVSGVFLSNLIQNKIKN